MRANRLFLSLLTFTLAALTASAQAVPDPSPAAAAQLSPQAAYQQALHPLEVTRHNIANWSDTEIAAMKVAIANAKAGCEARQAAAYAGPDLVDLARLCSLGQQWTAVVSAASRYINAPEQPKPLLTDAYVAQTEALLRLKQEGSALDSALAMLKAVPYSADVGDCIDEALGYMRFVHTADALTLGQARQPLLLAALSAANPPRSPDANTAGAQATPAAPQASALYAQGLLLPALQQLAAKPADAQRSITTLEAALPAHLTSDDKLLIAGQQRRYALLGKPLRGVTPLKSLSMPFDRLPALPVHGAITALLLFPDWCAQCVYLGPKLPPTVFTVEGHSAYVYALLAETVPAEKPDPSVTNIAFHPSYAAAMMSETPTITVSPETLTHFEAEDFPLLILTDAQGIVRVLQAIQAPDLQPGGDVDAAIALVGKNFSTCHCRRRTTAAGSAPPRTLKDRETHRPHSAILPSETERTVDGQGRQ